MAKPYAKAVMSMLPQTPFIPNDPVPHEPINDLPIHEATKRQMFHPVSESREFTRRHAARIFDSQLLPAEDRIPHPELYELEKWKLEGVVTGERIERRRRLNEEEAKKREERENRKQKKAQHSLKVAETPRWEFRFQDINADNVGSDGRDPRGVGMRYGLPAQDRKKGQIKIPRRVEA